MLVFIKSLPIKPKYLISKLDGIICDQGGDIVYFNSDLTIEKQRISDPNKYPIDILSHKDVPNVIVVVTGS